MADFLAQMAQGSRARAARLPVRIDSGNASAPLPLALGEFDLIAEIKQRSPAEGALGGPAGGLTLSERARAYARGGAAAVSVLTEPERFEGSMDHLAEVAAALADVNVPVMRKDFLVDPRQLVEARAAGASGALLIAALLDNTALETMLDAAAELGLFVLLESFDAADLARSAALLETPRHAARAGNGELLVGINTRNLRTLEVDAGRLERLAGALPAGAVAVAESGLNTPDDTRRVRGLGYRMGLVGTALMRADDPGQLVADMLSAARATAAA